MINEVRLALIRVSFFPIGWKRAKGVVEILGVIWRKWVDDGSFRVTSGFGDFRYFR